MDRQQEEAVLRRAILAGDEAAWRVVYDSHFGWLHRYVLVRTNGNIETTHDLLQETWIIAVRRMASFDPQRAPFRAWLKGIADKVLLNQYRRAHLRRTDSIDDHETAANTGSQSRNGEAIELALAALPAGYRNALLARYREECSVTEVAEQLNLTYKAAESLLSRARAAFRQAYNELENES